MARRHEQQEKNLSAQRADAAALCDQRLGEAAEAQKGLQRAIERLQQFKVVVKDLSKKKDQAETDLRQLRKSLSNLVQRQNLSRLALSQLLSVHLPQYEHAEAFKLCQLQAPMTSMDQLQLKKEYAVQQQRKAEARKAKHRQHEEELAPLLKQIREADGELKKLRAAVEAGLKQQEEAKERVQSREKEAVAKQEQAKQAEARLQWLNEKVAAQQSGRKGGGVGPFVRPNLNLQPNGMVPVRNLQQGDMVRGRPLFAAERRGWRVVQFAVEQRDFRAHRLGAGDRVRRLG